MYIPMRDDEQVIKEQQFCSDSKLPEKIAIPTHAGGMLLLQEKFRESPTAWYNGQVFDTDERKNNPLSFGELFLRTEVKMY